MSVHRGEGHNEHPRHCDTNSTHLELRCDVACVYEGVELMSQDCKACFVVLIKSVGSADAFADRSQQIQSLSATHLVDFQNCPAIHLPGGLSFHFRIYMVQGIWEVYKHRNENFTTACRKLVSLSQRHQDLCTFLNFQQATRIRMHNDLETPANLIFFKKGLEGILMWVILVDRQGRQAGRQKIRKGKKR